MKKNTDKAISDHRSDIPPAFAAFGNVLATNNISHQGLASGPVDVTPFARMLGMTAPTVVSVGTWNQLVAAGGHSCPSPRDNPEAATSWFAAMAYRLHDVVFGFSLLERKLLHAEKGHTLSMHVLVGGDDTTPVRLEATSDVGHNGRPHITIKLPDDGNRR